MTGDLYIDDCRSYEEHKEKMRMESEYSKFFDDLCEQCEPNQLSLHSFGALIWDEQEKKIKKLRECVELILKNYVKCNQNPHNDPTISHKILDHARQTLRELGGSDE